MSRIIGCRDLHIAELVEDLAGQTLAKFKTPVRIPSLISISITDSVEQNKFFSDDSVEQAFSKTSSKEVTIELGYITNEIEALITGKTIDASGVLVQKSDDTPTEIALLFRAPKSKDGAFRYLCLYKGTLTRNESEYATQEEGIESSNITLTGTFVPLLCNGKMASIADSNDTGTETAIGEWFTKVYGATTVTGTP